MTRTIFAAAAAVAVSLASATGAQAQTTTYTLNFNGAAQLRDQPGSGGANLLIDFLAGATEPTLPGTGQGNVFVVPTTTLPGVTTSGTNGTIQDLVVSSTSIVGIPVANFLTIGGYTFSLVSTPAGSTFGPITLTDNGVGTTASFGVRGNASGGVLSGPLANSTYVGVFSAQFAGQTPTQVFNTINTGGTLPTSFSGTFTITSNVIPEPSTYALMASGVAMLGLFAARRRRTEA